MNRLHNPGLRCDLRSYGRLLSHNSSSNSELKLMLHWTTPLDDSNQDYSYGDYQQQVNESTKGIGTHHAE
jgi:hypothetical protein